MTRARNMALWLVAAIVLIAAFAMPSGAQAHTGQMHAGQAHAGHAHAGPDRVAALPAAMTGPTEVAAVAVAIRMGAETDLARPCDGACCRPGTACCTGTALAPDTHAALDVRRPSERALARALPARTDVVPEALPEPPRSFA